LDERAKAISKQLSSLGAEAKVEVAVVTGGGGGGAASGDLVALGKEQWELQECYNCHKLYGQGGKKRGPEMDNIGNLMTVEQLKEKIIDPKSWKAEGFDKDYDKGKMPDKYKDLMFPQEIDALVAFLASLKDESVNTPKPIKMN
jgi:mono/diheme cytochrome c family protein